MKRVLVSCFLLVSMGAVGQFKNIKLAEQVDGIYPPLEPCITINKKNPKPVIILTAHFL